MPPEEVLAVARLRQWARAKDGTRSGRIAQYKRQGWQDRRKNTADAAIIRVIDFEKAIGVLTDEQQTALILRYRDSENENTIAAALGCSVRKLAYVLPAARRSLAAALEALHLL